MAIISIERPGAADPTPAPADLPFLRLGFRPFYLMAAAFAAISVPLWLLRYFGMAPGLTEVDLAWHTHEMIFGFAIAVVIGFLFTAGRNWTGLWTPRGTHLGILSGIWLAGRIAMLFAAPPLAAVVDLCFLPLAAWPMFVVLRDSGNRRNMPLVGLLALLWMADMCFHAARLGWLDVSALRPVHAAMLVIVIIESVIGGRVIPMFTHNGVPGTEPVVRPKHDRIGLVLTALACIAWVSALPAPFTAALAVGAAVAQLTRLTGWMPHRTLGTPLVWILHFSYGWLALGFLLMAAAALGLVSASSAMHALGLGAIGGMIIGMMTRTALGHTGRPLKAGRSELAMYLLIQVGTVARLAATFDIGALRNAALTVAMLCWSSAFLLYLLVYGPYLLRARLDGREG